MLQVYVQKSGYYLNIIRISICMMNLSYLQLGFSFPVAIFRGIFLLLICFEVASVLEVCFASKFH